MPCRVAWMRRQATGDTSWLFQLVLPPSPSQYSSADKVRMGRITGIGKNTIPHS
jgi:hypothetical protein